MSTGRDERPAVAVSLGDPWGIGPEVVAKALRDPRVGAALSPLLYGDLSLAAAMRVDRTDPATKAGEEAERAAGAFALACVDAAASAVEGGAADALCTAPLSKHRAALARPVSYSTATTVK